MFLEYAGHAKVLAKELDISNCDGIVVVSGDGVLHEVRMIFRKND